MGKGMWAYVFQSGGSILYSCSKCGKHVLGFFLFLVEIPKF
jgi:hypothetical protein